MSAEQRNTSLVKPPEADLFREAKEQIDLLAYLDKQHRALGLPAFRIDGAAALMKLHAIWATMMATLFLEKDTVGIKIVEPTEEERRTGYFERK